MASLRTQRARLSHLHTSLPFQSLPVTSRLLQHSHLQHSHLQLRYKSHARPSSSAQPADKRTVPSTTSTSSIPLSDDINPPPSTLPADLDIPESLPDTAPAGDKVKRYFSIGRAYLSFYKTGLKNVYHNYRASLPIRRSLGITARLPTAPPAAAFYVKQQSHGKSESKGKKQLLATKTSRSTFQLLHRAAHDVRRMIPFSLILIICGELTPFLILAFGNAVTPYTCRIPRQIEKYRSKRLSQKTKALSAHSAAVDGSVTPPEVGSEEEMRVISQFVSKSWVEKASDEEVLRACAVLGLAESHTMPSFLVGMLYRRRLRNFVEYLELDDELMRKCGGAKALEAIEVRVAVEERAGFGVAMGDEGWQAEIVQRRWLEKWLERAKK